MAFCKSILRNLTAAVIIVTFHYWSRKGEEHRAPSSERRYFCIVKLWFICTFTIGLTRDFTQFKATDLNLYVISNPNPFSMMMIKIIKVQLEQNVRCQKGKRNNLVLPEFFISLVHWKSANLAKIQFFIFFKSDTWNWKSRKKQIKINSVENSRCLKITKESHSTLRAKRATFTFWGQTVLLTGQF